MRWMKRKTTDTDAWGFTEQFSMRVRALVLKKQAKTIFSAVIGVIAALVLTALLAMPHLLQEPVEVAAVIEEETAVQEEESAAATVRPDTPERHFEQHEDTLLVLVNGMTALPEEFTLITRSYDGVEVNLLMYADLCAMLDAAKADGCTLWLASGYRSVEKQASVLEKAVANRIREGMTREAAYENARLTIQAAGHSEHHTGLAIDFNTVSYDFEASKEYAWLQAHAVEYGFVERYPQGKESDTGIEFEPWHYRYVGKEHALRMKTLNLCLEEYVAYCFENGIS